MGTLFQATFQVDDLLIKADIFTKTETGWHLIEVKSSTKYKANEHLPDVAFQVYLLQQAGIHVTQASPCYAKKRSKPSITTTDFISAMN